MKRLAFWGLAGALALTLAACAPQAEPPAEPAPTATPETAATTQASRRGSSTPSVPIMSPGPASIPGMPGTLWRDIWDMRW